MFRKIGNDAPVHTQDVQDLDTAVIAYNIIGNIKNCQVVSFQKKLRRPMTGLLRIS